MLTPELKIQLATTVYDTVVASTATFGEDYIGEDLAYLLAAILKDSKCGWPEDRAIVVLLREHLGGNHHVFKYIEVEEDDEEPCSHCGASPLGAFCPDGC